MLGIKDAQGRPFHIHPHTVTGLRTLAGNVAAALRCGESIAMRAIDCARRGCEIVAVPHG
jgi:hypothetical protein